MTNSNMSYLVNLHKLFTFNRWKVQAFVCCELSRAIRLELIAGLFPCMPRASSSWKLKGVMLEVNPIKIFNLEDWCYLIRLKLTRDSINSYPPPSLGVNNKHFTTLMWWRMTQMNLEPQDKRWIKDHKKICVPTQHSQ